MTEQAKTIRAAGYVRVSTQEQVEKGWNLDEDKSRIEAICAEHGWTLVRTFDDGGRQGDDPDRPGLLAMIEAIPKLDVVVARAQDRLSRDPVIWGTLAGALRKHGVTLHTFAGVVDIETPTGEFMQSVLAAVGKLEKRNTGLRVTQALSARASAGLQSGGAATYGYQWQAKELVVVPAEAEVVRRIYDSYVHGMSQRAIARALHDDGLTNRGVPWRQTAVSRFLANPVYKGVIAFKGNVLPGSHEAIIEPDLWARAEAIRTSGHRRKGGRHADGGHLLVRGVLRCGQCGSAMIPRKARPGVERARYVCSGRIQHGHDFCDQPSIRREQVDDVFLRNLLDHYVDLDAARRRIAERCESDLAVAREAVDQAQAEVGRSEARTARVQRGWQDGVLDDDDYRQQREQVRADLEASRAALQRAQQHAQMLEQQGVTIDAEDVLLRSLADVKRAVAQGAGEAPNLHALRNAIGELFVSVELVRFDSRHPFGAGKVPDGYSPGDRPSPVIDGRDGRPTYALLPRVRWSAVESGSVTPVAWSPQYPPSDPNPFLSRYCWWYGSA